MPLSSNAVLLIGGTGAIGRLTARALRHAYPDLSLLIGGRNLAKAHAWAEELGQAEGVAIDSRADDLGLGNHRPKAVVVFYSDDRLASLRFAHARGIPHLGISSGIFEIAPEVATYMLAPSSAAIVLGYEWLVGATTVGVMEAAKEFAKIAEIEIGALVDDQDQGGPAVAEDFERLNRLLPAAFTRRDGAFVWRSGEDAKAEFPAIDGTSMQGTGFSSIDVAGLSAATGAATVTFNLATGVTSSRRRGEPRSTEILISLVGTDHNGQPLRTRHAVFHPDGAAHLTALGTSMILERLVGLDGNSPTPPGLYFPFQVLDHSLYLQRLRAQGGDLLALHTT